MVRAFEIPAGGVQYRFFMKFVEIKFLLGKSSERWLAHVLVPTVDTQCKRQSAQPSRHVEHHITNMLRCFDHVVRCHNIIKRKTGGNRRLQRAVGQHTV